MLHSDQTICNMHFPKGTSFIVRLIYNSLEQWPSVFFLVNKLHNVTWFCTLQWSWHLQSWPFQPRKREVCILYNAMPFMSLYPIFQTKFICLLSIWSGTQSMYRETVCHGNYSPLPLFPPPHYELCIFSQMESKLLISRLLQTYKVNLPEDYKVIPVAKVSLRPKDGVPCTLEPLH